MGTGIYNVYYNGTDMAFVGPAGSSGVTTESAGSWNPDHSRALVFTLTIHSVRALDRRSAHKGARRKEVA